MVHETTKQKIVAKASDLFYRQGYNATGINQIIEETGVAKATMYRWFTSKEDLLIEYLTITAYTTNLALNNMLAPLPNVKARVEGMFDFLLAFGDKTQCNGCSFLNIAAEVPAENGAIRALIRQQKDQMRQFFVKILQPEKKENLADEMYVLFDGAMAAMRVYGDTWPVLAAKKAALKLL